MDENQLWKRIDKMLKKTGYDEQFIREIEFHLKVLHEYESKNRKLESEQELCNLLLSKLFVDKMEMFPVTKFDSDVNENSCWPVPLLPSEIFTKTFSEAYRKNCFYKCLNISDILDCRVASVNPSEYSLRVIHKYGATRMLNDLNLVVLMPKTEEILRLLGKELLPHRDLIRVAVTKIDDDDDDTEENEEEEAVDKKIVYVTLDENNVVLGRHQPTLGRIPEKLLPSYELELPNPGYNSYSEYLKDKIPFHLSNFSVLQDFGIDCEMIHSFYPESDKKKCEEGDTVEQLMEKARLDYVIELIQWAIAARNELKYSEALTHINKAIKLCPHDEIMLSSLHNIKGTIYRNSGEPNCIKNALLEFVKALKLMSNQESARKNASECIFKIAMKYYSKKDNKKAVLNAQYALELYKDNSQASSLLAYLKEKHPRAFKRPEEETLGVLETQKAALLSKLKSLVDY